MLAKRIKVPLGPAVQTFLAHQRRHALMTHGMTLGA
jgi:hypothetical protein